MTGDAGEAEAGQIRWSSRLGSHLEAIRVKAGMRRLDLANRIGVSEETIRLWERGAVQPSEEHLVRLIPMLSIEASTWTRQQATDATTDEERPEIARRLRAERTERGLTQAAMATELGVPQATYAGWETGRAAPGPDRLPALASLIGLPLPEVEALCSLPFKVDYADWPAFGQVVGGRRQALRLSRADLAEALGVTPRAIMSWELGYRRPQAAQIAAIARVLGVSSSALLAALPQRSAPSRLGALILSRQRELGLQSTDLARLVGTTEPTVSRWINGHSRPGTKNLQRLAKALRTPLPHVIDALGAPS